MTLYIVNRKADEVKTSGIAIELAVTCCSYLFLCLYLYIDCPLLCLHLLYLCLYLNYLLFCLCLLYMNITRLFAFLFMSIMFMPLPSLSTFPSIFVVFLAMLGLLAFLSTFVMFGGYTWVVCFFTYIYHFCLYLDYWLFSLYLLFVPMLGSLALPSASAIFVLLPRLSASLLTFVISIAMLGLSAYIFYFFYYKS